MKMSLENKRTSKDCNCDCPTGSTAKAIRSWIWTLTSLLLAGMIIYFLYNVLFVENAFMNWWNSLWTR